MLKTIHSCHFLKFNKIQAGYFYCFSKVPKTCLDLLELGNLFLFMSKIPLFYWLSFKKATLFACCSLLVTFSSFFVIFCSLLATFCWLVVFFARCSLIHARCLLHFAHCSLLFAYVLLLFARCLLLIARYL